MTSFLEDDDSIPDTESIHQLSPCKLKTLCLGLSPVDSAGVPLWKKLAEHLGRDRLFLDQVERDFETGQNKNPGYTILKNWMEQESNCTIKVLKNGFERVLLRADLATELDHIRKDYVELAVTLAADGVNIDLSGQCPGRRQLFDYIRVIVKTKMATALLRGGRSSEVCIKMLNMTQNRHWSSPARNFQGAHVFLEKVADQSQLQKRFSEISAKKDAFSTDVQRHFFSLMLDDILMITGEDKPMTAASVDDRAKIFPSDVDNISGAVAASTIDSGETLLRHKKKREKTRIPSDDELTPIRDVDQPIAVPPPIQETSTSSSLSLSLSSTWLQPVPVVDSGDDCRPSLAQSDA